MASRKKNYRQTYNRINESNVQMIKTEKKPIYAHTREIKINRNSRKTFARVTKKQNKKRRKKNLKVSSEILILMQK